MLSELLNSDKSKGSNPLIDLVKDQVISNLTSKVGLGKSESSGVADNLIPKVLGSLVGKAKDPNVKGFEITDIINALTGGDQKSSGSLLSKISTSLLDQNGDGKLDMGDLISAISNNQISKTSRSSSKTKSSGNSGLGGLLGKLFK